MKYMDEIIRVWLYKPIVEELKFPEAKPSHTNQIVTKEVYGDFKYYNVKGDKIRESSRKEAEVYKRNTGKLIETFQGYPTFMYDLGYRV